MLCLYVVFLYYITLITEAVLYEDDEALLQQYVVLLYYIPLITEAVLYEDDEEFCELLRQHTRLLLEEEELLATGVYS